MNDRRALVILDRRIVVMGTGFLASLASFPFCCFCARLLYSLSARELFWEDQAANAFAEIRFGELSSLNMVIYESLIRSEVREYFSEENKTRVQME